MRLLDIAIRLRNFSLHKLYIKVANSERKIFLKFDISPMFLEM